MDLELNLLISKRLNIPIIDILDLVQAYWMVTAGSLEFKRSPRKLTILPPYDNPREVKIRKKEIYVYIRYSARQRVLQEHSIPVNLASQRMYTRIIKNLWMPN